VTHACNPSTQEAEAGGLRVQYQPGPHRENSSQKTKEKKGRGGEEKKMLPYSSSGSVYFCDDTFLNKLRFEGEGILGEKMAHAASTIIIVIAVI
jgi:hypothetical protein